MRTVAQRRKAIATLRWAGLDKFPHRCLGSPLPEGLWLQPIHHCPPNISRHASGKIWNLVSQFCPEQEHCYGQRREPQQWEEETRCTEGSLEGGALGFCTCSDCAGVLVTQSRLTQKQACFWKMMRESGQRGTHHCLPWLCSLIFQPGTLGDSNRTHAEHQALGSRFAAIVWHPLYVLYDSTVFELS